MIFKTVVILVPLLWTIYNLSTASWKCEPGNWI